MAIFNMSYYTIDSGWQPGANTIAYYPLTSISTGNDMSGNNRNLTNNGVLFGEYFGVDCAMNNSSTNKRLTGDLGLKVSDYNFSINCRVYKTGGVGEMLVSEMGYHSGMYSVIVIQYKSNYPRFTFRYDDLDALTSAPSNAWNNICCTYDKATKTQSIYINGVFSASRTATGTVDVNNTLLAIFGATNNDNWNFYGGISRYIIENKARTAQEVADYYNLTKGNYGL